MDSVQLKVQGSEMDWAESSWEIIAFKKEKKSAYHTTFWFGL